jgi:sulfhydrogenase subunit beta (sulfur reductase)
MAAKKPPVNSFLRIDRPQFQLLIEALRGAGYQTVGPRIEEGAIVYREFAAVEQLPIGWIDQQDGGTYRLERADNAGVFDYVVGPESLKNFLFPPRERLLESVRTNGVWHMTAPKVDATPLAVVGARACDLRALAIQDRIFLGGPYVDPGYHARRQHLFVVAVNCRRAAATCFCHSMNSGPAVKGGFDLAITELENCFVVEVGTPKGGEVIATIDWSPCTMKELESAEAVSSNLLRQMRARDRRDAAEPASDKPRGRFLDTSNIHDLLLENLEHPRWAQVADRCLACANCTMVCPTCFCASVEDVSDLQGDHVGRERAWDSCFTAEHSYMNTGTVRKTTASRYRQWLTHKLATWIDQFGGSGCVGCGRCITWCPVGIDLTEEIAAIRGVAT